MLVALKTLTYGTRRMKAGDTFEASRGDGNVLCLIGLAREADNPQPASELAMARQEYRVVYGREADGRWGVDRIRKELAR